MLTISSIKNVQSTINNKNISFKAGVQSNYGADVINNTSSSREASFLTDFLGTIKQSPLFYETFLKRQISIEKGLNTENKINTLV
ncbi:MAG: hypothetical protein E7Z88_02285 [Cyanobacteria bacterium SIG27]|nr:hypothetical protein [Cyanobacteria bacterium SIG27]